MYKSNIFSDEILIPLFIASYMFLSLTLKHLIFFDLTDLIILKVLSSEKPSMIIYSKF